MVDKGAGFIAQGEAIPAATHQTKFRASGTRNCNSDQFLGNASVRTL
jgi:hypothetical protein